LQEKLDLKDAGAFRAASALAGGIVGRGETCGALIGGIMAIGQVLGRETLEDSEQFQRAMVPATEMYLKFKEMVGHTLCAEIQKILFSRSFNLWEEEGKKGFFAAGGRSPEGCPAVGRKAARIAAGIILEIRLRVKQSE
jgi:C_GCAxxG_C_C family probable redox protein